MQKQHGSPYCRKPQKRKIAKGATENFPREKITDDDEGEVRLCVIKKPDDTIVLDFGKKIYWIGLDKQLALELAETIIKYVRRM